MRNYMAWRLSVDHHFGEVRGDMGVEARAFIRLFKNYMPKMASPVQEGDKGSDGLFANVTEEDIKETVAAKLDNNWRQRIWQRKGEERVWMHKNE